MAQSLKWLALPSLAMALLIAGLPLLNMGMMLVSDVAARTAWLDYYAGERSVLLFRSLILPAVVMLVALIPAVAAAAIWFFGSKLSRRMTALALFMPMWIHPMALVFGLMLLLRQGKVADVSDAIFRWAMPHGGAWVSVVGVMALLLYPLAGWPAVLAIQRVPSSVVASAKNLGAGPWQLYRDVLFPAQREALAAGATLIFLQGAGFFVCPVLLGDGWVNTLPVLLANRLDAGLDHAAWIMALALAGPLWLVALVALPLLARGSLWGE